MTKFHLTNFGCRASQADGAALKRQLLDAGLAEAASRDESEIAVLNTCTVTATADAEVRQIIRRGVFEIRIDTAFDQVIAACADRPEGTWISDQIRAVYCTLHRQGHAHSVECWQAGELAGGLYGVALGGAFFGESMFTRVTNASKVALVALVERLKARGFTLLDTQWSTPHLARFGAVEIPRPRYLRSLRAAVALPCRFTDAG